jgi:hypothetical protein
MRTEKFLRVGFSVVVGVLALALLSVGLVSAQDDGPVQIAKMVMPTDVEAGDTVTYTIMLTATETLTESVMMTDTLNINVLDLDTFAWITPTSGVSMPSEYGVLTWMGDVSPTQKFMFSVGLYEPGTYTDPDGESFTVEYPDPKTVTNTAYFSYMDAKGEDSAAFVIAAEEEMYYIYLPLVMKNFGG